MTIKLAPSILSADFSALGNAVKAVERGGADLIHVDVMDGHFVPNITIGPAVVQALKRVAKVPLDVHLMISEPDAYIESFAKAGADMISVHVEVLPRPHRTIQAIKQLGISAGVVLNPSTPVSALEEVAEEVDYVLIMSVNPGFGGQKFIPKSELKIKETRALLDRLGSHAAVEIDGGIDKHNIGKVVSAGTDIVVAGAAVFCGTNPEQATRELKTAAIARGATLSAGPL